MVLQVVIVFSTEVSVYLRILFLLDVTLHHGIRDATAQQCTVIVEEQTFHLQLFETSQLIYYVLLRFLNIVYCFTTKLNSNMVNID
jgi:hypothetical protein